VKGIAMMRELPVRPANTSVRQQGQSELKSSMLTATIEGNARPSPNTPSSMAMD